MSVVFIGTKGNKTNNTHDNEWFIHLKERERVLLIKNINIEI